MPRRRTCPTGWRDALRIVPGSGGTRWEQWDFQRALGRRSPGRAVRPGLHRAAGLPGAGGAGGARRVVLRASRVVLAARGPAPPPDHRLVGPARRSRARAVGVLRQPRSCVTSVSTAPGFASSTSPCASRPTAPAADARADGAVRRIALPAPPPRRADRRVCRGGPHATRRAPRDRRREPHHAARWICRGAAARGLDGRARPARLGRRRHARRASIARRPSSRFCRGTKASASRPSRPWRAGPCRSCSTRRWRARSTARRRCAWPTRPALVADVAAALATLLDDGVDARAPARRRRAGARQLRLGRRGGADARAHRGGGRCLSRPSPS